MPASLALLRPFLVQSQTRWRKWNTSVCRWNERQTFRSAYHRGHQLQERLEVISRARKVQSGDAGLCSPGRRVEPAAPPNETQAGLFHQRKNDFKNLFISEAFGCEVGSRPSHTSLKQQATQCLTKPGVILVVCRTWTLDHSVHWWRWKEMGAIARTKQIDNWICYYKWVQMVRIYTGYYTIIAFLLQLKNEDVW